MSISVGCSFQSTKEQQKVHKLTVLHTNDHHGRFWRDEHDQYGMSARQTLVNQIRAEVAAEGGHVLFLGVILILVFLSLICKTQSLIFWG